jgi:hypothetical protein
LPSFQTRPDLEKRIRLNPRRRIWRMGLGFRAIHDFFLLLQWQNHTQFQKEFVHMRIQRICANLWELLQYCNSKENKFHHV